MTAELSELTQVLDSFPSELTRQVLDFALFLRDRYPEKLVNFSWEWSDQDMRDFTIASMRYWDSLHPDEVWGDDYDAFERSFLANQSDRLANESN